MSVELLATTFAVSAASALPSRGSWRRDRSQALAICVGGAMSRCAAYSPLFKRRGPARYCIFLRNPSVFL